MVIDWRHMTEILQAGEAVYDRLVNLCCWIKKSGGMGSLYRSRQELVFIHKVGLFAAGQYRIIGQF